MFIIASVSHLIFIVYILIWYGICVISISLINE